jgi:hypothetical protein
MGADGIPETGWRSYPERCALAASVSILAGVALFAGGLAWYLLNGQPDSALRGGFYSYAFWIVVALAYLVAPLLGVVAVWGMASNERHIVPSADAEIPGDRIGRALNQLLIASALLIGVGLLPLIGGVTTPGVWVWFLGITVLGAHMGWVVLRVARRSRSRVPRAGVAVAALVAPVLIAAGAAKVLWPSCFLLHKRAAYATQTPSFCGASAALERTVVVPTLDSPCPQDKNVIWCSSFQLAWNEVRDRVVGAPLEVPEVAELAARLNSAAQSLSDLDPQSVYATGGRIRDGIVQKIEEDMTAKFPSHSLPDFNHFSDPRGILAYSYLLARVPFKYPFLQIDDGLTFTDSRGVETPVAGFGLWKAYLRPHEKIREQVEVLYSEGWPHRDRGRESVEYALDLCRHSEPYQVVVALVEPKASLADMLDHVRHRIEEFKGLPHYEEARRLHGNDVVEVPEMFCRIDHRFEELVGKVVSNVGMPIVEALQSIEFRLDRSGAILESEARFAIAASPRYFGFDRPFLVCMKKRDAEHPFFVMWVDNAELLVPR